MSPAAAATRPAVPYRDIIDMYNSVCVSLPRAVTSVSRKRREMIGARYRDAGCDMGEMRAIFERIERSDFLCGRTDRGGRSFFADFGWIIRPGNFEKIREGRYDNRGPESSGKHNSEAGAPSAGYMPTDDAWKDVFTEV